VIICHPLKLIFLKTKKVAGTSFEVALSKFCSSECIITPISAQDEQVRANLGFRGPQNYLESDRVGISNPDSANYKLMGDFINHSNIFTIKDNLRKQIFDEYTKLSIHREPADVLVSKYFYRTRYLVPNQRPSFAHWYQRHKITAVENYLIAPVKGEPRCDKIFAYEHLLQEIKDSDLLPSEFTNVFDRLRLKSHYRDIHSQDASAFFERESVNSNELSNILKPYI